MVNFLAAHCFSGSNYATPRQQTYVILGSGINQQNKNATKTITHPNWRRVDGNFDSDIAVVRINEPIDITPFVHPICLPWIHESPQQQSGLIVGHSKSNENHKKKFIEIPVKNITACLFGDQHACLFHDSKYSCDSISGSGFYSKNTSTNSYEIAGIYSKGLRIEKDGQCGLNSFIVFTYVRLYVPWITKVMSDGSERRGKAENYPVEIFCDYRWNYLQ